MIAQGYEYLVRRKLWQKGYIELVKTEATPGRDNYLPINDELWFREVRKGEIRYLFCFNPQGIKSNRALLEERLDAVESELKAIEKAVEESRYKSFKKPFNKNTSIFKNEHCLRYFNWNYDRASKKFTYRRKNELLDLELDLAGIFVLETNSTALSGRKLVESYINSVQIGESFKEIKNFEVRPNKLKANLNISANILVCVLAAIIEKTLERIVRVAGINLSSRQTLHLLEEIKITVNQLGGREVKSVTGIDKTQGEILHAVGVVNL
jgi:transposase